MAHRILNRSGAPAIYWNWAIIYACQINNYTSHAALNWKTPWEKTFGETPDISAFWGFSFYQKVRYLVKSIKFPENKAKPGRWLGIDWESGDQLTYKILPDDPNVPLGQKLILTRSVLEPDDDSNLRCNQERIKGW